MLLEVEFNSDWNRFSSLFSVYYSPWNFVPEDRSYSRYDPGVRLAYSDSNHRGAQVFIETAFINGLIYNIQQIECFNIFLLINSVSLLRAL